MGKKFGLKTRDGSPKSEDGSPTSNFQLPTSGFWLLASRYQHTSVFAPLELTNNFVAAP